MCHFHQKKIIQRYITMRPKLEIGEDLKKVMTRLTQINEKNFTVKLNEWHEKYKDFLEETTLLISLVRFTIHIQELDQHIEV